jgi:hypothetical protein
MLAPSASPDASRPWVCVPGKCPVLLLFRAEFFYVFSSYCWDFRSSLGIEEF